MNKLIKKEKILYFIIFTFIIYFFYKVRGILLPFILGFLIAYSFKNLVKKYENKISRHWLSIEIIFLFSVFFIILSIFVFPYLFLQLIDLLKEILSHTENIDFNKIYMKFNEILKVFNIEDVKELQQYFLSIGNFLMKIIGNLTNNLISSSFQIVNIIFMICISPIIAFYFLRDWDKIFTFLHDYIIPENLKKHYITLSERIDDILHHYIIGQLNVSLILGSFYSLLLFIIDFKYAFIVGIFAGFLTLLPYVGAFGGVFLSLILGYFQFGASTPKLLSIIFIFCLGQFLEGNFITPNLIGNKIQVHPLWLLFGIFVGGSLYGFWGIVVSMPLAGIIGVLVRFYFEEKEKMDKYGINNR